MARLAATSPMNVQCALCEQWWVTTQSACPHCGVVWLGGGMSDSERETIRRFLQSAAYRNAKSDMDRAILVYEQLPPRPAKIMAYVYLAAAHYSEAPAHVERYLRSAARWLRTERDAMTSDRRTPLTLQLIDTLRRTGQFAEARQELAALVETKSLPPSVLADCEAHRDLLEIESRIPLENARRAPTTIETRLHPPKRSTFDLPVATAATIASSPRGQYPVAMRYAGIAGEVLVAVAIDAHGAVTNAKMISASQAEFVNAALNFARGCRFAPDVRGAFETAIAVSFSLKEE